MIAMADTNAHKEWNIANYQNKGVRNMETIYSDWRQTDKNAAPQPPHNYLQSYLAAEKADFYGNNNDLGAFGGEQQSQTTEYLQSARSGMKRVPAGKTFIGLNQYNSQEPQRSQVHEQNNQENYLHNSKNIASPHKSIFLQSSPISITPSNPRNQTFINAPQKMLELPPERDQNLMNMEDYLRTSFNTVLSSPEEKNKQMPNSFPVFSPRDQYALPAAAIQQGTRNPMQNQMNINDNNKLKDEWVNDIQNNQNNPLRNKTNSSLVMTTIPQQQTKPQLKVFTIPFEGSRNQGYLQAPLSARSKRIFAEDEEEDQDMLNRSASYARNIEILNSSLNQQGDFFNQTRRNYNNNRLNRSNISNENDMSRVLNGSDNDILSNQVGFNGGNARNNNSILQQSYQNQQKTRFSNNNNSFSQNRWNNNYFLSKRNPSTSSVLLTKNQMNNPKNINQSQKHNYKQNKSWIARESAALEACEQQLTLQQVYCHNCLEFVHFAEWEKADEHSKYCVPVEEQLQQYQTVQQHVLGKIMMLNSKLQKMEYLLKKMETILNDEQFLCCRYEVKQVYLPGIHDCLQVMTDSNCSASSEVFHSALGQFKQHTNSLDALQAVYSTPESTQFLQILNAIIEITLCKIELARKLQ